MASVRFPEDLRDLLTYFRLCSFHFPRVSFTKSPASQFNENGTSWWQIPLINTQKKRLKLLNKMTHTGDGTFLPATSIFLQNVSVVVAMAVEAYRLKGGQRNDWSKCMRQIRARPDSSDSVLPVEGKLNFPRKICKHDLKYLRRLFPRNQRNDTGSEHVRSITKDQRPCYWRSFEIWM